MVNLNEYRDYFRQIAKWLNIDNIILAVQEEHLRKKVPGTVGVILAVVYPSGSGTGIPDNVTDVNTCLLFVLENSNKTDTDSEKEFDTYTRLQCLACQIKECIVADSDGNHPLFVELERQSFQIEPEWNIAGSYVGYSVSFNFSK